MELLKALPFKWRAILAIGIAAAPLFSLALFFAYERQKEESTRASTLAMAMARTLAAEQGRIFIHARQLVAAIAVGNDAPDDTLLGPECDREVTRLVHVNRAYYQIGVADPHGNLRCGVVPLSKPQNIADRGYFLKARDSSDVVLSGVIVGRETGKHTVVAAQALRDERRQLLGVLFAAIDLGWLQLEFERAGLPRESRVALVDPNGIVVAESGAADAVLGRRISDSDLFQNDRAHGAEPVRVVRWLDDIERITAYSPVVGGPADTLYLRVGIPVSIVQQAAARVLREGLALTAVVLLTALAAAWFGSAVLITKPLRRLGEAASRIGKGDFSTRTGIDHRSGEIGQVARKLDELATSNQRTTRALRTLSAGNRTLLREKSEDGLLRAMCEVAVKQGGYRLALVTYALHDDAKSVVTRAHAGYEDGFIESLNATWADSERGQGTIGSAIRTGKTEVVRSVASDPRAAPWRAAMLARGYGSAMSIPLRVEGSTVGTLTFVAPEEDAFDRGEQELLEEMAADLSFGIETVRLNQRRLKAEEIAKRAAMTDALTGLPNRARFLELLQQRLAAASESGEPLAVLVVHLPGLQQIYDALGHDLLNQIFVEIAKRLASSTFAEDGLARLQDNDFALFRSGVDVERARALGEELLRSFELPVVLNEAPIEVRACIGASFLPGHGKEAEILARRAAIAARDAAHKDLSFNVYRGMKERENPAGLALTVDLRNAIEQRVLTLHYQPKVDLVSGAICGSEALIRWPHPGKGMIPPVQFVPLAEQTGLIRSMTYLVLETAIRQQRAWLDAGSTLPVAVNLSARNLYDPELVQRIEALLNTWGIEPRFLELEITEGALIEDTQTARAVLERLRPLCGKIYIDDFGTGYSSLSYLVSLPVHALKIDRSFVIQMTKSRQARSVVESVISMAHALGLRVVAEGVETSEDASILRQLGCDEAQGYLFGRPTPASRNGPGGQAPGYAPASEPL